VSRYVEEHRGRFGVEPICRTLGVSASAYYERRGGELSERAVEDERLLGRIRELHAANYFAYGYRRMWKALGRAGERVPRCRVQRLMATNGIQGAKRRGKPWRTTKPDLEAKRRPDLVQRNFSVGAANQLWVADLSYLRCWEGLVFFAFVLDAFSRMVVGWQLATNMRTTLVLALRMALGQRAPGADVALVHHSDRGSQYTSIDYTQELNDHRVLASVGSVGDAYDNALAESFVDSYKTELIADRVWRARAQLELATVEWVGWFNHDRLHEALGDLPPVEFERLHAAGEALVGPIPDDGSVAPSSAERLPAARIAPGELAGGQNGADPDRPPAEAADASRSSPSGLAALTAGADPTTLP
jgi:putative transposase